MKILLMISVALVSLTSMAQASEKDRGGGVVPYAEGTSSVTLSWNHTSSMVTINDAAAKLLFDSLKVEIVENNLPFALKGENLMKQKEGITCVSNAEEPKTYKCYIRVKNQK